MRMKTVITLRCNPTLAHADDSAKRRLGSGKSSRIFTQTWTQATPRSCANWTTGCARNESWWPNVFVMSALLHGERTMPLARRGRTARSTGTGAWANNSKEAMTGSQTKGLCLRCCFHALRLKDITIPSFADAFAELSRQQTG